MASIEDGGGDLAKRVALGFKDYSVTLENPVKPLVYNVSGYVTKGGVTAILGASGSGKSVLLQSLAARIVDLPITGGIHHLFKRKTISHFFRDCARCFHDGLKGRSKEHQESNCIRPTSGLLMR
jgi:energy-coupling factor transporter ATP-binding protein EcfA2